jgi:hypothetical protein
VGNILIVSHSIGFMQGIFSSSSVLLVTCREYSHFLASRWPQVLEAAGPDGMRVGDMMELMQAQVGNILVVWRSIGRAWGIFSLYGVLLVIDCSSSPCLSRLLE